MNVNGQKDDSPVKITLFWYPLLFSWAKYTLFCICTSESEVFLRILTQTPLFWSIFFFIQRYIQTTFAQNNFGLTQCSQVIFQKKKTSLSPNPDVC